MTRVASLYLPQLPIERLRRLERPAGLLEPARLSRALSWPAIDDEPGACSVPRGGGWRPGARWARDGAISPRPTQAQIDALPAHQRPTMREMGRRSEPAEHPFKAMRSDDGAPPSALVVPEPGLPRWGRPLVLIERSGQREIVTAACPLAIELGLHRGMVAAQTRALIADLDVRDAEHERDAEFLERLALHAVSHWTPTANVFGEDSLWLDLTGCTHLFGGEERFCRRVIRFLARLGFSATIAVAGTPGAAHALARYSGQVVSVAAPGGEAQAIGDLPLAGLRLQGEALLAAARFGFERIVDLYAVPRGPLAKRLGLDAVKRLDQARGIVSEPIIGLMPFEAPAVRRRLLEPIVTAEAIEQVMGDLIDDLVAMLQARHLGVRTLVLTGLVVDGSEQKVSLGTAKVTRDAKHLKRMLKMRIERIDPGLGIEEFTLIAPHVEALQPAMLGGALVGDKDHDIAPLVDQLAGRVGEKSLFRIGARESDVPERAVARIDPLGRTTGWPRWKRPARMLERPERLSNVVALLPDHPPKRFVWRGKPYQVVAGDGPERFHGEWWRNAHEMWAVRDYFRVETERGERFWLFRRGDGVDAPTGDLSWHLHGVFG